MLLEEERNTTLAHLLKTNFKLYLFMAIKYKRGGGGLLRSYVNRNRA